MTPERWKQVKEIFHSAIRFGPEERSGFLASACGDDDQLREEVESLILSHEKEGSFIDSPAYEAAADLLVGEETELQPGQVLGHYRIISLLGKGGMAQVFLAEDKQLSRKVALKFLPARVTSDPDRLRRFEQEARAASALNHPNILTIHEIREAGDRLFIATEFIDGETLRKRIASGPLPVGEVLNIAEQIASALTAAHAKGIVHRDIKPENIMLRPDGYVKVLDFGLAKLTEQPKPGAGEANLPSVNTNTGVVIGTIAYMSPEQTRGLAVDARTDVWSLGVLLYELLTGRAPFAGATASDVMVSVLEREPPPLTQIVPNAPAELQRIVRKTLRKDREERYQTIKDLQVDLKNLKQDVELAFRSGSRSARSFSDSRSRRTRITLIAVSMVVVAIGLIGIYRIASTRIQPADITVVLRTKQLTTWPGLDLNPALSPNGNSVAYSSDHHGAFEIYVMPLTPGAREIQLTADGRQNFQPSWSPDGKFIAFYSKGRGIWVIPASGGAARQLSDSGAAPAWSPDGSTIVFQTGGNDDLSATAVSVLPPSTLRIVSVEGGEARALTQLGVPSGGHGSATWSPDGKRLVFVAFDGSLSEIWSVAASGTDLRKVSSRKSWIYNPIYAPDGEHIYFGGVSETGGFVMYKLRVSATTGEALDEPVEVFNGGLGRIKQMSISTDGKRIVYSSPTMRGNISSVSLATPAMTAASEPVTLTQDTSQRKGLPRFSPDGRRIAFVEFRGGTSQDIWVMDADGNNPLQLTTDPAIDWAPSWFPDSDQIAFESNRQGSTRVWSISINSRREKLLVDPDLNIGWPKLSPDGKQIVFNSSKSGTINVWTAAVAGGAPRQLTFDQELAGFACWSPDGNFLALELKRGADNQVAFMPSGGGAPIQLTFDHGLSWPDSWSPDGDKIAFAGERNNYWNVYWVSRSTKEQRQLTNYKKLNAFVRYPDWDPSGKRIIYEYSESAGNIWLMELK